MDPTAPATPTLSDRIRLDVSVVVLAGPDEASLALEGLGHHVVYQTVLVPDTLCLIVGLVLPARVTKVKGRGSQNGVGSKVKGQEVKWCGVKGERSGCQR